MISIPTKLEIDLIVFSDGVEIYKKGSTYEETLNLLKEEEAVLAQCENTLKERKIDKSELLSFYFISPYRKRRNYLAPP